MEKVINKLSLPFWVIAAAVILIFILQAHNFYWQGRLAKAQYQKQFGS